MKQLLSLLSLLFSASLFAASPSFQIFNREVTGIIASNLSQYRQNLQEKQGEDGDKFHPHMLNPSRDKSSLAVEGCSEDFPAKQCQKNKHEQARTSRFYVEWALCPQAED